jgi:HD-GYP domain-containing protein (c-di-GMP phosphodiesterase class II)
VFSRKTVISANRPGGEKRGKLRARIATWSFAFVVGTALALVAYFVSWALTVVVMTGMLMFAIVQVTRTHNKERAGIENHMSRASRDRETIIDVLLNVLSLRDNGRMSQSDRIAELAAIVAWQLGLKEFDVRLVKQASMLHDVGKMGIADGVLAKPGELNKEEWAAMRRHPEVGHDILGEIASSNR